MTDNPDLWEVRELPGGLALEMPAGDDPALLLRSTASEGVAQGENRVRVELAHVKALADLALALGLAIPAGQDYGNRWQWVVNARLEAGRMKGDVIQQGGRQWQTTRRLTPGAQEPGCPAHRDYSTARGKGQG
jgi:hypothetical protein